MSEVSQSVTNPAVDLVHCCLTRMLQEPESVGIIQSILVTGFHD